mmetsp:Transcript_9930/g.20679  ORF Transcript_9930/g.20679 Transcript_9930/m.20679 type:complete len:208 (+) Transcript_9930:412-1035(+)
MSFVLSSVFPRTPRMNNPAPVRIDLIRAPLARFLARVSWALFLARAAFFKNFAPAPLTRPRLLPLFSSSVFTRSRDGVKKSSFDGASTNGSSSLPSLCESACTRSFCASIGVSGSFSVVFSRSFWASIVFSRSNCASILSRSFCASSYFSKSCSMSVSALLPLSSMMDFHLIISPLSLKRKRRSRFCATTERMFPSRYLNLASRRTI